MDKFIIQGSRTLKGSIQTSGAKNASLALMPATILAPGSYRLSNTPELRDVGTMRRLLETLGVVVTKSGDTLSIDSREIRSFEAPYEHVKKMRASI
jgi:UDP-N-acetylglucosamine 1-carboxyvinyltransferase